MKKLKIHIVGNASGSVAGAHAEYASWIDCELAWDIKNAGLVLLAGGTDISPSLYNRQSHPTTQVPDVSRDIKEKRAISFAQDNGIPILGICRGAQLLCAMAGGILVQDQKHPSRHEITTASGRKIIVSSSHHQRAYPFDMPAGDYKILGWATNLSPYNEGENMTDILTRPDGMEVEDVYYPKLKALGIQGHPEYLKDTNSVEKETLDYYRGLVDDLLSGKL